jgi:hypothetical protein
VRWLSRVIGLLEQPPIVDADRIRTAIVMTPCKVNHHTLAPQVFQFYGAEPAVIEVIGILAPQRETEFRQGAGD